MIFERNTNNVKLCCVRYLCYELFTGDVKESILKKVVELNSVFHDRGTFAYTCRLGNHFIVGTRNLRKPKLILTPFR